MKECGHVHYFYCSLSVPAKRLQVISSLPLFVIRASVCWHIDRPRKHAQGGHISVSYTIGNQSIIHEDREEFSTLSFSDVELI